MRNVLALATVLLLAAAGARAGSDAHGKRQLRVAFVTYQGSRQDRSVGQAAYEGFVRAVRRLGLSGRVVEVRPFRYPTETLMALARQRYDLIVDAAPTDPGPLVQAARAYPKAKFLVDGDRPPFMPTNVQTYVMRVEEAAYLAGHLAALMEKARPGKDVVGSVGGEPYSGVDAFVAGFRAGARAAVHGITTLNAYSHDFTAPAKCRAVALAQISRGAGVIFNVAGACGLGALDAARSRHVWGIGVDTDQSFLGSHILTSVVKRYDVAIYAELRALKEGRFRTGGTTSLGLKQMGVGLGRISPKAPRTFVSEIKRIRAGIVAGRIHVPSRIS